MRLCFILEELYQNDEMPMSVATHVRGLGHTVDILEPHASVTELGGRRDHPYDAYVLKTAPDGPGLSILESAGAAGVPTMNPWRSIRLARDKAVAVAVARANGLPMPRTFLVNSPELLALIDRRHYPLVVKPCDGGGGRAVYRVNHPAELADLGLPGRGRYLAQTYVENAGFDVKVYNTGREVFAVRWPSPLHDDLLVTPELLPVSDGLREITLAFGSAFGLKIYGVDLLATARGWVAVDVNDFPSFHEVPDAVGRVASSILEMAGATQRFSGDGQRRPPRFKRLERDLPLAAGSTPV